MSFFDYKIHLGSCLEVLKDLEHGSIQTIITSPPYFGLRDYHIKPVIWPEVSFSPISLLPAITIPKQTVSLGDEEDIWSYIGHLIAIFREAKKVLRDDGTFWLNLGDSYSGSMKGVMGDGSVVGGSKQRTNKGSVYGTFKKPELHSGLKNKDLMGIPWRTALALQADGWYLRSDIIWAKPGPMPESVKDRPTKAHEYVFMFSKSEKYYYDIDIIREKTKMDSLQKLKRNPVNNIQGNMSDRGVTRTTEGLSLKTALEKEHPLGSNKRSVWVVNQSNFPGAHFATFPEALVEPMVLAGCPENGVVLDPFTGTGTVGVVCSRHKRRFVGIEINEKYVKEFTQPRLGSTVVSMFDAEDF